MSDERFDIDVSYRDPWDRRDELPEDQPSAAEYEDALPPLPEDCDEPAGCTCPVGSDHCLRRVVDGRWQLVERVAMWGARGWKCPACGEATNMYGHGHERCRSEASPSRLDQEGTP